MNKIPRYWIALSIIDCIMCCHSEFAKESEYLNIKQPFHTWFEISALLFIILFYGFSTEMLNRVQHDVVIRNQVQHDVVIRNQVQHDVVIRNQVQHDAVLS